MLFDERNEEKTDSEETDEEPLYESMEHVAPEKKEEADKNPIEEKKKCIICKRRLAMVGDICEKCSLKKFGKNPLVDRMDEEMIKFHGVPDTPYSEAKRKYIKKKPYKTA